MDRQVLGRPEWALAKAKGDAKDQGRNLLYFCGEFANYETPLGAHSAVDSGSETADALVTDVTSQRDGAVTNNK